MEVISLGIYLAKCNIKSDWVIYALASYILFLLFGLFLHGVFFCVKPPAPEAQLDDAIGFLRDHVEVNVSRAFLLLFLLEL